MIAAKIKVIDKKNKEATEIIEQASEELRNIYDELEPRSLEKMSLKDAIEWYLLKFYSQDFPYSIEVKMSRRFRTYADRSLSNHPESIANAKKHAPQSQALEIAITLRSNKFKLIVRNELPIDHNPANNFGRGLKNIQLRAESLDGKLVVKKSKGLFEVKVLIKLTVKKGGKLCIQLF